MKNTNQFTIVKKCRKCNSTQQVDVKTGLCWFCKKREEVSFEVEYIKVAHETI